MDNAFALLVLLFWLSALFVVLGVAAWIAEELGRWLARRRRRRIDRRFTQRFALVAAAIWRKSRQ